jgi:2-hydroxychromene-2-carboxylate isomerase
VVVDPLKVEFRFDVGSQNAYLAEPALPGIAERAGAKFEHVPVLLGGIYRATNNMPRPYRCAAIKSKPEYQALETQRFIRQHGIRTFKQKPFFPVNTLMMIQGRSL